MNLFIPLKIYWIYILAGLVLVWFVYRYNGRAPLGVENYGLATITQITARGPQDTHLTQDARKYLPSMHFNGHPDHGLNCGNAGILGYQDSR